MSPANDDAYQLRTKDGQAVRTFKKSRGGSTKRKATRPRREIRKVAAPIRLSQVAGRDRGPHARDSFLAPEEYLAAIEDLCDTRGWDVEPALYLNYTGGELDRLLPYIERMELPLDHPELLDALVFPNWERFSRAEEGPVLLSRIRDAGGDAVFADQPHLDIYDNRNLPQIHVINAIGVMHRLEAGQRYRRINEAKVKQGVAYQAPWCYTRLEKGADIEQADGTVKHYPKGSLIRNEDRAPWGTQAYDQLYTGVSPGKIARWLNENNQLKPGRRRRNDEGELYFEEPREWVGSDVIKWARNVILKGCVQWDDTIAQGLQEPITSEEKWEAVNSRLAPATGRSRNPGLCSGVLRCAHCRRTLGLLRAKDGAPLRYQCGAVKCDAHASVSAASIDALASERLYASLEANRNLHTQHVLDHDDGAAAELSKASRDAEADLAKIRADYALYKADPDTHRALVGSALEAAEQARDAHQAHLRKTKVVIAQANAVEDWKADTLTTEDKNQLLRCTWPIIWVRTGRHLDESGGLVARRPLHDRLWFIPEGDESKFELPRRMLDQVGPVPWHDGTTSISATQHREIIERNKAKAPGHLVSKAGSPAELERWMQAREEFVANGRTDAEIAAAVHAADTVAAAARELGMGSEGVRYRVRRMKIKSGELEEGTLVERLKRKNYKPTKVSDEEILAAVELHDGKLSEAAKELGMPLATLSHRHLRLRDDPEARERVRAQQEYQRRIRTTPKRREQTREAQRRYRERKRERDAA